jgi:hypothetical protein
MREKQRELSENAPLLGHDEGESEKRVVSGKRQLLQSVAALAFVVAMGISAWQLGPDSQDEAGISEEPASWAVQVTRMF